MDASLHFHFESVNLCYDSEVNRKSYQQFCGLACALDVLGERWTLLVVRELMFGPRRFVDLLDAMPGIGSNTLTTRLRALEEDGLIVRGTLPPPVTSAVYRLTPAGQALEPVIVELGRWGMSRFSDVDAEATFRPEWLLFGLKLAIGDDTADLPDCACQFLVDGSPILLRVRQGRVEVTQSSAENPDVTLQMDTATIKEIGLGGLSPLEAVGAGRISVAGRLELVGPLLERMGATLARA